MKILLVGNYPLDPQPSMFRYAAMLQRELGARGHEVELVTPSVVMGRLGLRGGAGKWLGYVDKYLMTPWKLRRMARLKAWDAVHVCDHSNSMYLKPLARARVTPTITCHDLMAVMSGEGLIAQHRVSATGRVQQRWIWRGLQRARRVVCVSGTTERLLRERGFAGESRVIGLALNFPFAPAAATEVEQVRRRAGLQAGEAYLLHVGGNKWYKNRDGVLRIFSALRRRPGFERMVLLMAGQAWNQGMKRGHSELDLGDAARAVVEPSNEELRALYTGAEALLFPSLMEGFGWPVLEAQSCGCVVVTSDREPMRDVAGGAAILMDPENPEAAAERIALEWGRRAALRDAGFRNVERFSPGAIFEAYEKFFQDAGRSGGL